MLQIERQEKDGWGSGVIDRVARDDLVPFLGSILYRTSYT